MAKVQVKLIDPQYFSSFILTKDPVGTARLHKECYRSLPTFVVEGLGETAAEEVFDLTNNPSRQDEREDIYGNGRSVSTGDIVRVDGVDYLCCSLGWEIIA